jgi:hypothetical protein
MSKSVESEGGAAGMARVEAVDVDVGWDAQTVYVAGVKEAVKALWVLRFPRGRGFATCSAFTNAIEACVGYFLEEVQEEQEYSRFMRRQLERKWFWKAKEVDTKEVLRIIDADVRDWLAVAKSQKHGAGNDVLQRFDALCACVAARASAARVVADWRHYDGKSRSLGRESREDFFRIVRQRPMDLYKEVHPLGKYVRTSALFEALILCCVRCLWEEWPASGLRSYGDMTWHWKGMTTAQALLAVKGDVRR